jgi:hypothetical protein
LAATKMDDDYKKNLLPTDFQSWDQIARCIVDIEEDNTKLQNYEDIDIPPFLKQTLISIIKKYSK